MRLQQDYNKEAARLRQGYGKVLRGGFTVKWLPTVWAKGHISNATHQITQSDEGWINATDVAAKFNKEPTAWLRQLDVLEYMAALSKRLFGNSGALTELAEINELVRTYEIIPHVQGYDCKAATTAEK